MSVLDDSTTCAGQGVMFPNLDTLYLSKTSITQWDDIHALRNFPQLRCVTLQDIPLLFGIDHKQSSQVRAAVV